MEKLIYQVFFSCASRFLKMPIFKGLRWYFGTKCEIYTRVMGYFRPVSQFNIGKKSEHKERVHFEEQKCESQS